MADADKQLEPNEMHESNSKKNFWPPIQEEKQRYLGLSSFYECRLCERTNTNQTHTSVILYYEMQETYHNEQLGIVIPKGSVTFAYYWTDRPYNLYHMMDPSGETLGYYFNVADRTKIEEKTMSWRDLIVDVFVRHGNARVLDEDEIPPTIEPEILQYILQSRDLLLNHYPGIIDEISQISTRLWTIHKQAIK